MNDKERLRERLIGIRTAADAFESDALLAPMGATFRGGALDGASIHNVDIRAARKLREFADAVESGRLPWPSSRKLEVP